MTKEYRRRLRGFVNSLIEAINYATKNTTKMKAKFSYCDQIKFNEPVLKNQEHQNSSTSLTTNC